jgi:vacuole morphology and inheritance protein 14
MEIVIEQCRSSHEQTIRTAFTWVLVFLQKYKFFFIQNRNRRQTPYKHNPTHTKTVSFFKVLSPTFQTSKDSLSISGVSDYHDERPSLLNVEEQRKIPVHLFPKALDVVIPCFNHPDPDIKKLANDCNNELITILEFFSDIHNSNIKLFEEILKNYFNDEKESTMELVLVWVSKLFRKFHDEMFTKVESFMECFIALLCHNNDHLFNNTLDLICEIARYKDEYIEITIMKILDKLRANKRLLDVRGMIILKKLCTTLNVDRLYSTLADVLLKIEDQYLIGKMINILSVFMLKNKETESLRTCLKKFKNSEERTFFDKLFKTWVYNPISCIIICLIAEYFELSYFLIVKW